MVDIDALFQQISTATAGPVSWLIVGLGNPGSQYEGTRHNAGFMALDYIAGQVGVSVTRAKFDALVGEATLSGEKVLLMKPQTYMNLSGNAVQKAAEFYKIPPEHIVVLCDDISFEPGHLRLRRKGSAGGHNGLKDIAYKMGSELFPRFKMGVGKKPSPEYDLADWVLGKLGKEDKKQMGEMFPSVEKALELWISGKEEEAMNLYSK